MNAAELIRRATKAGIEMAIKQDGGLLLRAEHPPSAGLLAELAAHKAELIEQLIKLSATNDSHASAWLHLLVLSDGCVIQRCGEQATVTVENEARRHLGDHLVAVTAVPGYERPLTEAEIVEALAGTLRLSAPSSPPSSAWLARIARILGTQPSELLDGGYLEQHDLVELAGSDAGLVASLIRNSPAWINRAARPTSSSSPPKAVETAEWRNTEATAATASLEWLTARNALYQHLMSCQSCHAPTSRYCRMGSELRQHYNGFYSPESDK